MAHPGRAQPTARGNDSGRSRRPKAQSAVRRPRRDRYSPSRREQRTLRRPLSAQKGVGGPQEPMEADEPDRLSAGDAPNSRSIGTRQESTSSADYTRGRDRCPLLSIALDTVRMHQRTPALTPERPSPIGKAFRHRASRLWLSRRLGVEQAAEGSGVRFAAWGIRVLKAPLDRAWRAP